MSFLSFQKPEDLLKKCQYEFDQLQDGLDHPKDEYAIFNILVGLNHLFDWFLKEESISSVKKIECVMFFNPYEKKPRGGDFKSIYELIDEFPGTDNYQFIIRELCNKAKHFKLQKLKVQEKQDKHFTVTFGSCSFGSGVSFGSFDKYNYSVEVDGVEKDLLEVIEQQLTKWKKFLIDEAE